MTVKRHFFWLLGVPIVGWLVLMYVAFASDLVFPPMEPILERHLIAEQDFDGVCSVMDAQLGAATSADEVASIFERFNQSADRLIVAWTTMVDAVKTISKDKAAYINSGDYAMTDWNKMWKGTHLFVHAVRQYVGISSQSLDNVRKFTRNIRLTAALEDAGRVEDRLKSMSKDGEYLREQSKEWRPVESAREPQ